MQVRTAHHQYGLTHLNVMAKSCATPIKMSSVWSPLRGVGFVIAAAPSSQLRQPKQIAVYVMPYFALE